MNTPAHLLIGAAVALAARGRSADAAPRRLVIAAFIGSALPDASLYILAGGALFLMQIPPHVVFNELYYSPAWQQVFAIDNSFVLWGGLFALALWSGRACAVALTLGGLLHLALDFPLHHDDGRPHFWPLSDWVFQSPLSYWDRAHGARWIAPIEAGACVVAAISLWRWRLGWALSGVVVVLLLAELNVTRTWLFVFENS